MGTHDPADNLEPQSDLGDVLRRRCREICESPEFARTFKELILTGKAKKMETDVWKQYHLGSGPRWIPKFVTSTEYLQHLRRRYDAGQTGHLSGLIEFVKVDQLQDAERIRG
jgi:hypothetical protein